MEILHLIYGIGFIVFIIYKSVTYKTPDNQIFSDKVTNKNVVDDLALFELVDGNDEGGFIW